MSNKYEKRKFTMTKRERFMNFLAGKPVDRVPVAFFHHFCDPDEWFTGMENPEAFEKNVTGHKRALDKFDPDVIKVMNDSLMIMPLDTSFVKTSKDLLNIKPPVKGSPYFEKSRELTDRVLKIYAGCEAPKYVTGFSPIMILRTSLSGLDLGTNINEKPKLLKFLEEDPDSVVAALNIIGESIEQLNEMLIKECGADGVYFSVNNQCNYIPGELYRKYVTPTEMEVMAHANGLSKINLLHICGYHGKPNDLNLFKDYEAAAYNIAVYAEGVSLSDGKKLFGGKPVFGGFSQDGVIYTGSKEEVKEATWKILDECGQLGVMIGDDCTVPNDIDDSRFNWVIEACEEYAAKH